MSEATTDDTTAQISTLVTDIDDESKQTIRENARSLSPEDERLINHTDGLIRLNQIALSTMLFDAQIDDIYGIPEDVITVVFSKEVEFPEGDGYVTFEVRAETETCAVVSMTVNAHLYG